MVNHMFIRYPMKVILPPIQNIVGICNRLSFPSFIKLFRLVTFLDIIYASVQVPNIFVLTFKLISFVSQIFPFLGAN
jgi:hypothetical protein